MTAPPTPSVEAVQIATRIVLNLTGRRWVWPRRRVTEVYRAYRTDPTNDILILRRRPASKIISVTDQAGNAISAELSDSFRLKLLHQGCCFPFMDGVFPYYWGNQLLDRLVCPREITVVYDYGSKPPADIQRAIDKFAIELDKMFNNDSTCSLPERVTSINRQGASWTLIDPQTFIDKGRTGIYYIDIVLGTYGKAKSRAMVFSPQHSLPRTIKVELAPE